MDISHYQQDVWAMCINHFVKTLVKNQNITVQNGRYLRLAITICYIIFR